MMTQIKSQSNGNTLKLTNTKSAPIPSQTNPNPANALTNKNEEKKVSESAQVTSTPVLTMTEAPYSWNVTVIDGSGFVEQFTVRAINERPFFERVGRAKKELAARGYKPMPRAGMVKNTMPQNNEADAAPMCAIHKTPMTKRQGKNGSFWSCSKRLDDGSYCPYRPTKQ